MKSTLCYLSLALAGIVSLVSSTAVATYYAPTLHSEYQKVYDDGSPAWLDPDEDPHPISLVGVVINKPADMLDSSITATSPKWQMYIQATDEAVLAGDFGGTALYMMRDNYGDGTEYYNNQEWTDELIRIDAFSYEVGDIVRVDALAPGMFFCGKYNVNEMHLKSSDYDFSITVIGRTTATAQTITLAALKSTETGTFNQFIFDQNRITGCEHYQGSLVHLEGLQLIDGVWEENGTVTVQQMVQVGEEMKPLTFTLLLGLDEALFYTSVINDVTNNLFDITAILDQETPRNGPYTGSYRLWLTSRSDLTTVPEPCSLALLAVVGLAALLWRRRSGS